MDRAVQIYLIVFIHVGIRKLGGVHPPCDKFKSTRDYGVGIVIFKERIVLVHRCSFVGYPYPHVSARDVYLERRFIIRDVERYVLRNKR